MIMIMILTVTQLSFPGSHDGYLSDCGRDSTMTKILMLHDETESKFARLSIRMSDRSKSSCHSSHFGDGANSSAMRPVDNKNLQQHLPNTSLKDHLPAKAHGSLERKQTQSPNPTSPHSSVMEQEPTGAGHGACMLNSGLG